MHYGRWLMILRSSAKDRPGTKSPFLIVLGWARQDSNLRPTGYEPAALTAELRALLIWGRAGNGTRTRNNSLEG
jgi:hypothetical protein